MKSILICCFMFLLFGFAQVQAIEAPLSSPVSVNLESSMVQNSSELLNINAGGILYWSISNTSDKQIRYTIQPYGRVFPPYAPIATGTIEPYGGIQGSRELNPNQNPDYTKSVDITLGQVKVKSEDESEGGTASATLSIE